jgi:L-ascorbate metabolism protein UlaG (beta-lactamase superfamily)
MGSIARAAAAALKRLAPPVLRAVAVGLPWTAIVLCLAIVIVPNFLDRRYYDGPESSHYDGARFFNPDGGISFSGPRRGGPRGGIAGYVVGWLSGTDGRPPWPDAIAVKQARPAPFAAPRGMKAIWVGHATVLVQAAGLNILTDPIWSDRASPVPFAGPERIARPGIRFEDLPKIDLVLVSHNHYDHLDIPTLKRLWQRDRPVIVTALGNDSLLAAHGIPSRALDWGEAASGADLTGKGGEWAVQCGNYEHCPDYRVHAVRSHHWTSRWGVDRNRALWSAFLVETRAGRIFFAGDTGAGNLEWADQARRLGPIRLAIIPIGAFRFAPGQMESDAHVGPGGAVTLFRRLGATSAIPIHWGTFRLSWEAWDTPPRMLELMLACEGIARKRFAPLRIGQEVMVPGTGEIAPDVPKRCDRKAIAALP